MQVTQEQRKIIDFVDFFMTSPHQCHHTPVEIDHLHHHVLLTVDATAKEEEPPRSECEMTHPHTHSHNTTIQTDIQAPGLEKTGLIPHLHKREELDLATGQDLEPLKEGLPHPQCRLPT